MDWKKWLGRIDRWAQSAWFWGGLIFAAAGGSLIMLGRATELFQAWAPFSYGLAFWLGLPIALWCLLPLRRLIPERKDSMRELGADAVRVFDSASRALARMEMRMPLSAQVQYAVVAVLGRMSRAGLASPAIPNGSSPEQTLRICVNYLGLVGPLLFQGEAAEAHAMAQSLSTEESA